MAQKGKNRQKIAPRVNFDHLGVIWGPQNFEVSHPCWAHYELALVEHLLKTSCPSYWDLKTCQVSP